ncbi:hypothetical protein ROZALSC1DRAFT_25019, partial [Rozella allomycis CSF55]
MAYYASTCEWYPVCKNQSSSCQLILCPGAIPKEIEILSKKERSYLSPVKVYIKFSTSSGHIYNNRGAIHQHGVLKLLPNNDHKSVIKLLHSTLCEDSESTSNQNHLKLLDAAQWLYQNNTILASLDENDFLTNVIKKAEINVAAFGEGASTEFIRFYDEPKLLGYLFPDLYPYGTGYPVFDKRFDIKKYACKQKSDPRWQLNVGFIFFVLDILDKKQLSYHKSRRYGKQNPLDYDYTKMNPYSFPAAIARVFDRRLSYFKETYLNKILGKQCNGIVWHYTSIEASKTGGLHAHMLIKTNDSIETLIHKERHQLHICTDYCSPDNNKCRFNLPRPLCKETQYRDADNMVVYKTVTEQDKRCVPYIKELTLFWEEYVPPNSDVLKYITKYTTKPMDGFVKIDNQLSSDTIKHYLEGKIIPSTLAAYMILGHQLVRSSHKTVFLPSGIPDAKDLMLKSPSML